MVRISVSEYTIFFEIILFPEESYNKKKKTYSIFVFTLELKPFNQLESIY